MDNNFSPLFVIDAEFLSMFLKEKAIKVTDVFYWNQKRRHVS